MENSSNETVESPVDNGSTDRPVLPAEPEQPELENVDDLKHSHKPNFGRFVKGCVKCESNPEKYRKKGQKRAPKDGTVNMTYEQLQDLLSKGSSMNSDAIKTLVTELRRPEPEEEERRRLEKERLASRKAIRVAEIQLEEDMKKQRQSMCGHMKENGRSAIVRGQVFSDGCYHPMCHRCGKELEVIPLGRGEMAGVA